MSPPSICVPLPLYGIQYLKKNSVQWRVFSRLGLPVFAFEKWQRAVVCEPRAFEIHKSCSKFQSSFAASTNSMSKPPADLTLFSEDVRVVVRNDGGSYSMSAFPADVRTKDWIAARQKETTVTRNINKAPSELQWRSLGLLEFMEVDGQIWTAKPRKKQIIFNLSMLIPEHVDALQTKIERKHNIRITQEQIQPVTLSGFQATIEIKENDMKRVFAGYVKNLDAVRPMHCVFDFSSVYDMELVLEELASDDGVTMTCYLSIGEIRFERTALAIPKQRIVDAKIAEQAFGDNMDYALFTTSQLNELAQMFVNTIVISELNTLGGSLIDAKPMILTSLQAIPVEFTREYIDKISPLNGEKADILTQFGIELEAASDHDVLNTVSPRTILLSPDHVAAGKVPPSGGINLERKRGAKDSGGEVKMAHKASAPSSSPMASSRRPLFPSSPHRSDEEPLNKMYRVQRSKLLENMTIQWFKIVNPQLAIFNPIEIDTKSNVCSFTDKSFRDLPRCVTNVSIIRLPNSAWLSFKPPSDSGGSPIESYTVYAEPLVEDESERVSNYYLFNIYFSRINLTLSLIQKTHFGKETPEQKYARRAKVMVSGTSSPINIGPLRPDMIYRSVLSDIYCGCYNLSLYRLFRFSVECFNASGASRITEPVLATVEDNEHFATVPLYGIILYSGPLESIPSNFRKLDGSELGVPNLYSCFNMKTDVSTPATAATLSAAKSVPWMGGLCYIQRIY